MGPQYVFSQHSRSWRDNRYVYPVISRRSRGLSIGVNLNPDKACNFDCVYCCVDRTTPAASANVDMQVLSDELQHMLGLATSGQLYEEDPFDQTPPHLRRLNDLAFSGDGEPTSFRGFFDACRLVAEMLEKHGLSDVKIIVITNATLLHRPAVKQALEYLDQHNGEVWAKLDAGSEAYYRRVERTSIPLSRVLENIAVAGQSRPIVIQSLFMTIDGQGPDAAEIQAYTERLRELMNRGCQIKLVQIYTTARRTAELNIAALPEPDLDHIARQVRQIGLKAEIYP